MSAARTVLVIDDDPSMLVMMKEVVQEHGYVAVTASAGQQGLARLEDADVVVTDLQMPGMTGIEVLRAVREQDATVPVVVLTAHGSERAAVAAMKAGAYDYLTKPVDIDEVTFVLDRAMSVRELRQSNRQLSTERSLGRRLVAESLAMRKLLTAVERVADKDVTVLIRGETGTGKELIASLLHAGSRRASKPFVRFNCAAISAALAESLLFGHVKGAFTDARNASLGYFAEADGGTLVLDEIGELAMSTQAVLLRALQEGEIQRVGSPRPLKVDVRVVASTNRDLLAEVRAGRFREDLYYRLAVVELVVPPLRDRSTDIPTLAEEFARRYGERFGPKHVRLTPDLIARLGSRDWPGNVRQLENTIARLVALSIDGVIDGAMYDQQAAALAPSGEAEQGSLEAGPSLAEQVSAFERNLVVQALEAADWNQSEAARLLSTRRSTLLDKIKRYSITR
jgi:DNA-binding NtrC family response regulator